MSGKGYYYAANLIAAVIAILAFVFGYQDAQEQYMYWSEFNAEKMLADCFCGWLGAFVLHGFAIIVRSVAKEEKSPEKLS